MKQDGRYVLSERKKYAHKNIKQEADATQAAINIPSYIKQQIRTRY